MVIDTGQRVWRVPYGHLSIIGEPLAPVQLRVLDAGRAAHAHGRPRARPPAAARAGAAAGPGRTRVHRHRRSGPGASRTRRRRRRGRCPPTRSAARLLGCSGVAGTTTASAGAWWRPRPSPGKASSGTSTPRRASTAAGRPAPRAPSCSAAAPRRRATASAAAKPHCRGWTWRSTSGLPKDRMDRFADAPGVAKRRLLGRAVRNARKVETLGGSVGYGARAQRAG